MIDDGANCLSACAVMFVLGTEPSLDNSGGCTSLEFDRRMHVNATMGFHRRDLSLPEDGPLCSADAERRFDIAFLSILEFVRVGNNWKQIEEMPAIAPDLLRNMLQHEGEDFFCIDTVDKAGRWDISGFRYDPPETISAREAVNSYDNLSNWVFGLANIPVENADIESLKALTDRHDPGRHQLQASPTARMTVLGRAIRYITWMKTVAGGGNRFCQMFVAQDPLAIHACGGGQLLGRSFFACCSPDQHAPVMDFFDP